MNPLLHSRSQVLIDQYLARPSHGLLLTGPAGVGKQFVARWLAEQLGSQIQIVKMIEDKSKIGIDQIQKLYTHTRTNQAITIIIPDAETMSREAQNAFLKLLEEPPSQVRFILTTARPRSLLATIRSRTQMIDIVKPSKSQLQEALAKTYPGKDISSLELATNGLPGRLFTLLGDETQLSDFQTSLRQAKQFYSSAAETRFSLCAEAGYEKLWARQLLDTLAVIVSSLLRSPSAKTYQAKLLNQAMLIEETIYSLHEIQGNPKIHLSRLALEL